MYDVIIIGAGPAGTAAGYNLACAGHRVLILDRKVFPRKKACAGGITPKAMNLFPYDISHLVLRTCRKIKITRPCGSSFTIKDTHPLCYMVRRKDLDYFSLTKAMAAGAKFATMDRILFLDQTGENRNLRAKCRLSVQTGGKEKVITGRFIIGADGANSHVRRLLEKDTPGSFGSVPGVIKYPALEADVRVERPWEIPMEFDFSRGIPGYFWIFPRHDHVNIGIFSTASHTRPDRRQLEAFAEERLGRCQLEGVKGYPIGVTTHRLHPRASGRGCVLLTGDAAGFAEPLLGEGIYGALKSGQLAAGAIDRAIRTDQLDALKQYHDSLAGLRMDLRLYYLASKLLYRFPNPCLGLARYPLIHGPFRTGFATGRSLGQIIFPFQ